MLIQPTISQLQVEKIESNSGYTILNERQLLLPLSFNYSIHIIDPVNLRLVADELKTTASFIFKGNNNEILKEIEKIEDKIMTLESKHHSINKRGILNILGTINKWISGTMDDEDRQLINKHFEITDYNTHEIIKKHKSTNPD